MAAFGRLIAPTLLCVACAMGCASEDEISVAPRPLKSATGQVLSPSPTGSPTTAPTPTPLPSVTPSPTLAPVPSAAINPTPPPDSVPSEPPATDSVGL